VHNQKRFQLAAQTVNAIGKDGAHEILALVELADSDQGAWTNVRTARACDDSEAQPANNAPGLFLFIVPLCHGGSGASCKINCKKVNFLLAIKWDCVFHNFFQK
jgi:hypothetical protein